MQDINKFEKYLTVSPIVSKPKQDDSKAPERPTQRNAHVNLHSSAQNPKGSAFSSQQLQIIVHSIGEIKAGLQVGRARSEWNPLCAFLRRIGVDNNGINPMNRE